MPNVLVYAAHEGDALTVGAREVLSLAGRLVAPVGGRLEAVVIGTDTEAAAREAIACGADRVFTVNNPLLAEYQAELYLEALGAAARESGAEAILLSFDTVGKELVGRLATRLRASALTEVISFEAEGGKVRWKRPLYGGKAIGEFSATRPQAVVGVRPRSQEPAVPDSTRAGEAVAVPYNVSEQVAVTRLVETIKTALDGVRLEDARIIIAGGRGLGGPEPFRDLQLLAEVLGGVVGASRAACDAGWQPPDRQVGQTGSIVAPDLYIAVGISGASQHLAGITGAKTVVAINKDPEAPIFRRANIGLVADYKTVIPTLTEALRQVLVR